MVEEKIFNVLGVDYIVASNGKIYSTKNIGRGKYHKEITQRENEDGYMTVTVGKNDNRTKMSVHRIVAMAFIENPDNLPEVDHIDNDRKNNDVSNLQWISSCDNKSKIPFETRSKNTSGMKNGRAKLTDEDVIEIRRLYNEGMRKYEIANKFHRGWSTIHNIIINNTWKGLTN